MHLTTLSLAYSILTDQLLGLLIDHTQALEQLSVYEVALATAAHKQRVWGLQVLTVGRGDSTGIEHLPVPETGKMCWRVGDWGRVLLECDSDQVSLQMAYTHGSLAHTPTYTQ